MREKYNKNCPNCGELQTYTTKSRLECSIREKWVCNKCSSVHQKKIYSEEIINNVVESIDDARYLEIGTWAGSTACSALYGNKVKTTCVDNWTEFGGPKDLFFSNIDKLKSPDIDFSFIENDFNLIDYTSIGKFNVYMYDGSHSEENQYNGITKVLSALDDTFLLVVDDWNWYDVRSGTLKAIEDNNLNIVCNIEIRTMQEQVWWAPDILGSDSDWHNGYFIALIKKG
jgi:hypothetical protein